MRKNQLLAIVLLAMACSNKEDAGVSIELASNEDTTARAFSADDPPPPDEENQPAMRLDEGAAGKPDSARTDGHMRLDDGKAGKRDGEYDRARAIEAARSAGVLGSRDYSSGFDSTNIYGGLTGERSGSFGYGRSGFGPGGGGTGRGIGTGGGAAVNDSRLGPDVKAGEWDDNANYRDYVKWLKETPRGIARLDVSERQFIVVRDKDGKPVPNCPVTIAGTTGSVTLTSSSSGRVLVFPKAYGLSGKLMAGTACANSHVAHALGGRLDDVTELVLGQARQLPARRALELAFVVDTTGSMSEEIGAVKQTIASISRELGAKGLVNTDVRIGLVEYKDQGDFGEQAGTTKTYPFSSDLGKFRKTVEGIEASGGGDMPEDMHAGLAAALDKLQWSPSAAARMIVVIADAPPHLDYRGPDYANAATRAAARGIKLYTVSASGMDTTGQIVMRQMAQLTGAANLFVLRGGAGPQSVGGGDPKSSCGGTQQQYASGNLDKLVLSKIKRELSALDGDPMRIPGIGKDESSKPCNQRIAMQ